MLNRKPVRRVRSASDSREGREVHGRRITQNRELNDSERVELLRKSYFQTHLPDIPPIPGYHVCWLTTQNPRDPIHGRLRLGYELIQAHEIPGFEHLGMKTGDYVGCIGVNEMIAAKLPRNLYEAFMREVHFDAPAREAEQIYTAALETGEQAAQAAKRGGRMKTPLIEPGTQELGQAREPPTFEP